MTSLRYSNLPRAAPQTFGVLSMRLDVQDSSCLVAPRPSASTEAKSVSQSSSGQLHRPSLQQLEQGQEVRERRGGRDSNGV